MRQLQLGMSMVVVLAGCFAGEVDEAGEADAIDAIDEFGAPDEADEPGAARLRSLADPARPPAARHMRRASRLGFLADTYEPYERPELWPYHVASSRIVVHYQAAGEQAVAQEVLGHVEHAWQVQIDQGGAVAPLDDHGAIGPDGRYDVYLWRGIEEPYVVSVVPEEATWYDDWLTAMVLDPWGAYGGPELPANVFHELRHATQASHDWWEHPHVFEAEATTWEAAYYGYERVMIAWEDLQARPDWTLFRDDEYETWYMYGGGLFLLYLRDHAFGGSLGFTNRMWRRSRNAPGAEEDPTLNEPDFADALESLLAEKGRTLLGEVLGFARARWRTGPRADGSLPGGALMPEVAHEVHTRKAGKKKSRFAVSPQILGTSYVVVERAPADPKALWVSLSSSASAARFVVQVLGGPDDDATLELDGGPAKLRFGPARRVTLAITALPAGGAFDPETVSKKRMRAQLTVSTTP